MSVCQLRPGGGRVDARGGDGQRAAGRGRGRGQPAAVRGGRLRRHAPRALRRVLPPREQPLERRRAHERRAQRRRYTQLSVSEHTIQIYSKHMFSHLR